MTAIEKGVVNGTTQKRMKELEARQEELERLILIERSKQSVTYTEAQIREYYEKMLKEEPQALINLLVKQIVLYDDRPRRWSGLSFLRVFFLKHLRICLFGQAMVA